MINELSHDMYHEFENAILLGSISSVKDYYCDDVHF